MKTKFTFFLFALYFINASAQIENFIKASAFPDEINTQNRHVNKLLIKKKLDSVISTYTNGNYPDIKNLYSYNTNGQETEKVVFDILNANQQNPTYKKIKEYDSQNRKSQEISMNWDNGAWQNYHKTTYQYNADNLPENKIFYIWDDSQQTWTKKYKNEYFYNSAQLLVLYKSYVWEISQWNLNERRNYVYDNNNRLTELIFEANNNGVLINQHKKTYNYNTFNKPVESISYDWNENASQWDEHTKAIYLYTTYDYLIDAHIYTMEASGWKETSKNHIQYDSALNATSFSSYVKYGVNWIPTSKIEFTYENTYTHDQLVLPESPDLFPFDRFKHQLILEVYYEVDPTSGNTWSMVGSSAYYYSDIDVSGLNKLQMNDFQLYPNPASDRLYIEINTETKNNLLIIYELTGKEILRKKLPDNHTSVDVSRLQKGIYFFRLQNKEGTYAGKLLIN